MRSVTIVNKIKTKTAAINNMSRGEAFRAFARKAFSFYID